MTNSTPSTPVHAAAAATTAKITLNEPPTDKTMTMKETPAQKPQKQSTLNPEGKMSTSVHVKDASSPATTTLSPSTVQQAVEQHLQHLAPAPPLSQPPIVALSPALSPYPHPQHPPVYYPIYHPHQSYLLSISPPLPISPSLSPKPPSTTCTIASTVPTPAMTSNAQVTPPIHPTTPIPTAPTTTTTHQRILPKSPVPITTTTTTQTVPHAHHPTATPYALYSYPYSLHISPPLHPTHTVAAGAASSPTVPSPIVYSPHRASVPLLMTTPTATNTTTTADQREQARKLSHSAIERRRREKINDKILQLKELIPSCAERNDLHKMTILQSAIDYITYLKKQMNDQQQQQQQQQQPPTTTLQETDEKIPNSPAKVTASSCTAAAHTAPTTSMVHQQQHRTSPTPSPKQIEFFTHPFSIHGKRLKTDQRSHPSSTTTPTATTPLSTTEPFNPIFAQDRMEDDEQEEDSSSYVSASPLSLTAKNNYSNPTSAITSPPVICLKPKDIIQMNKEQQKKRQKFRESHLMDEEKERVDAIEPLALPSKRIVDSKSMRASIASDIDNEMAIHSSTSPTKSVEVNSTTHHNMNLNNLLC
ncbi:hypothetical protein BDF20DRAFT_835903 [Mycotypha africana]|uniref:uncharacterized protein n=1 Tax=Mycotypha africana TaxID=64632 RepID=UPI0023009536|nr:uncharacterized protein BDF20DRAFT_835903 [Mycotypha africana]KAI8977070.1 hypothetical protein BDF20DRAFT_835903 [Mycotypha africana]